MKRQIEWKNCKKNGNHREVSTLRADKVITIPGQWDFDDLRWIKKNKLTVWIFNASKVRSCIKPLKYLRPSVMASCCFSARQHVCQRIRQFHWISYLPLTFGTVLCNGNEKNSTEIVWPFISKIVAGHGGKPGTVQRTTSPITYSLAGASFEILSLRVNFAVFLACRWK